MYYFLLSEKKKTPKYKAQIREVRFRLLSLELT